MPQRTYAFVETAGTLVCDSEIQMRVDVLRIGKNRGFVQGNRCIEVTFFEHQVAKVRERWSIVGNARKRGSKIVARELGLLHRGASDAALVQQESTFVRRGYVGCRDIGID